MQKIGLGIGAHKIQPALQRRAVRHRPRRRRAPARCDGAAARTVRPTRRSGIASPRHLPPRPIWHGCRACREDGGPLPVRDAAEARPGSGSPHPASHPARRFCRCRKGRAGWRWRGRRLQSAGPRPRSPAAWPGNADKALPSSRWSNPPCRPARRAKRHAPCPRPQRRPQSGQRNRARRRLRPRPAPAPDRAHRRDKAASGWCPSRPR